VADVKICKYQYDSFKQCERMNVQIHLFKCRNGPFLSRLLLGCLFHFKHLKRRQKRKSLFDHCLNKPKFSPWNRLDDKTTQFLSFFFLIVMQGNCQSWRAEQYFTCNTCPCLYGSSNPRYTKTETTATGTRESRRAGCHSKGRKYGHYRVSTSVQEPTVELFHAQLPTRKKFIWKDSRSW